MHRTAQQAGYHANMASVNDNDDDINLVAAAQEFAAAESSRQTAVTQLTTTNTDLHSQLANLATHNQDLQQQMTQPQLARTLWAVIHAASTKYGWEPDKWERPI